jgi:transcriptional antiterminator RfaH
MENWYLLTCQIQKPEFVYSRLSCLGVTHYLPLETRITARKDRASCRVRQKPLFPGYLFVKIDPDIVHPTQLTEIPGVFCFVRFGQHSGIVRDEVVEALKCVRIMRIDPTNNSVECANLSPVLISTVERIYTISCPLQRQTEFMRFLERECVNKELFAESSCIYTSVTDISTKGGCEAV